MRQRNLRPLSQAAVILSLVMGAATACATSNAPAPGDHSGPVQVARANYIVSLSQSAAAVSGSPSDLRQRLDADRDRVLAAVFGADAPPPGASFVSAHAFEIRLTPDEAQSLMRHPDVVQVQADQIHRPTGAGSED